MKQRVIFSTCIALISLAIIAVFGSIVSYGLIEAEKELRTTAQVAELTKIRHAFHNYFSRRRSFPPRVVIDHHSQAVTFWPVLIEREMESDCGNEYNLRERWDSTSNILAVRRAPFVVCTARTSASGEDIPVASFVAINDLSTILQREESDGEESITDGRENTLLVAQVRNATDPWFEPMSLSFNDFIESCGGADVQSGETRRLGFAGQLLLFADFEIYRVLRPLPEPVFRALWTKDNSERMTRRMLSEARLIEPL